MTNVFFDENVHGVRVATHDGIIVTRNKFEMGNHPDALAQKNRSIWTESSRGFKIEENEILLSNNSISGVETYGIVIENTGSTNNQVYRNETNDINQGIRAVGLNRNPSNDYSGFEALCNEFYLTQNHDYFIDVHQLFPSISGVRNYQGTPQTSAGNRFSYQPGSENDISTVTGNPFTYWWNTTDNTNAEPKEFTTSQITLNTSTNGNSCVSRFGTGEPQPPFDPTERIAVANNFSGAKSNYDAFFYNYLTLLDGGDTEELLNEIQNSFPSEAWELRCELMADSPYLSQEVLEEAAYSGVLTDALLLEVCLANPDATRSEEFLLILEFEIPNPLPNSMVNLIVASWETVTSRTLLEGNLAEYGTLLEYYNNDLITDGLIDSIIEPDSVLARLALQDGLENRYNRVELNWEYNVTAAETELNNISTNLELSEEEIHDLSEFTILFNLLKDQKDDGRNILQTDSDEKSIIDAMAIGGSYKAAVRAQSILCFVFGECDWDVESGSSRLGFNFLQVSQETNAPDKTVNVYPNPANEFITFDVSDLNIQDVSIASIILSNELGQIVQEVEINQSVKIINQDISNLSNGIYFYKLYLNDSKIEIGKFTVKR